MFHGAITFQAPTGQPPQNNNPVLIAILVSDAKFVVEFHSADIQRLSHALQPFHHPRNKAGSSA